MLQLNCTNFNIATFRFHELQAQSTAYKKKNLPICLQIQSLMILHPLVSAQLS